MQCRYVAEQQYPIAFAFDLGKLISRQDRPDDLRAGVKGLAVLLGDHTAMFCAFLGLLQVFFFSVTALKAHMSTVFWVFGIGVWALNIPWHVISLDILDRKTGGKVFKRNIMLGLYMTGVALVELFITRVYLSSITQAGGQILAKRS